MTVTFALLLSAFIATADAGQPGGTQQVAPTAPRAPTATATLNPGTAVPATLTVSNGPLGRTEYALDTPEGCPGLTTVGGQQIRGTTALQLQAGAIQTLDACGRLATAQAGAIRETTLATAGAGLANPVRVTTTAPDGGTTVTEPIGGTPPDYARVDAANGVVVVANGPAATWAAASNGGQAFPMGTTSWGAGQSAWGPMMGAQSAISAGVGQPTPVATTPPPSVTRTTVTRPATTPPAAKPVTQSPQTPPTAPRTDPPEVTRALLED